MQANKEISNSIKKIRVKQAKIWDLLGITIYIPFGYHIKYPLSHNIWHKHHKRHNILLEIIGKSWCNSGPILSEKKFKDLTCVDQPGSSRIGRRGPICCIQIGCVLKIKLNECECYHG